MLSVFVMRIAHISRDAYGISELMALPFALVYCLSREPLKREAKNGKLNKNTEKLPVS